MMATRRMARRRVLQAGLGGIAALGPLPLSMIGARKAMADTAPETVVYVSNAGSKDIHVLAMNRNTGELTVIEKTEAPGSDKPPSSPPTASSPTHRFIYATLPGQPPPAPTSCTDQADGTLPH